MAAANAAPPTPSLITAPVEQRVLSSQVVDRGDVVPGQSASVFGPSSEDATTVTAVLVEVGDQLADGNPLVEVSGRPVVVFEGPVPAFRDMRPGMSGADIDALQAALARVGCDPSADDGTYGEETKRCVGVLYDALGYPTMPTSDTEAADLADARDAVAEAEDQLGTAQAALDEQLAGPDQSEVVTAQVALDAATRKVADTAAAGDDARAKADAAVAAAVLKLNAELADRTSTPAERADALAALDAAVLEAEAADRTATEDDQAAAEAVRTAQAALDELTAAPDADAETLAVEQAEGARDRATEALTTLEARSGPIVPRGEIVFIDVLPATVISLSARVGSPVGGTDNDFDGSSDPLAVVATAGLRVEALVSPSDAELLTEGMEVELRDDISGDSLPATLTDLGDQVATSEDGNDRGFRAIVEADDTIPREWTGRNVRVTFTGAETATEVLVVPVSALSSSADGEARVEVVGDDGTATIVAVEAGLSADGFVEVTPLEGAELAAGDLVVVGSNGGTADS
jgi:peptidoglycan hydrolase-like protein with peptidoglycan-binding domain